ncbi:suppressor of cytokine signaling 7-like [Panulirus ornatus]|uniref:suppressor of cytokine signaling 7-like n=1 Tax=Panulirus ornatus TaxID=150431 RepID=UPI003A894DB2
MLVCPGCHLGLTTALPTLQTPTPHPSSPPVFTPCTASAHWVSAAHLAPGGVQPPYVCGRMFQVGGLTGVRPCLPVQHDACHVLCCLACPHACPTFRTCATKASCAVPEVRNSLHTSGGGLVEGQTADRGGSVSPDAKVNNQAGFNPFRSSSPAATPNTKPPMDASSSVRLTPPPKEPDDSQVLTQTRRALEESGWYYGALSCDQAAALLQDTAVGTFLLRDSASPQCLYSLSVQTRNGPTSVRIHYSCGKFRLDCTGHSQKHMPEFEGVVPLVEHYVRVTSTQVWVDHEGKTFSPIDIKKPLRQAVPSLQHLCRLALNASGTAISVPLPPALRSFLKSYPHSC